MSIVLDSLKVKLLVLLLLPMGVAAQSAMGGWTLHVPTSGAIGVAGTDDLIYCAFSNGVLEYDLASGEKTILSSIDFLSDIDLTSIGQSNEAVFIGYQNGNIDKLQGGNVTNIPAIRLAQIQGVKRINRFVEHNGLVYVATGFGIVVIDPKKNEVKETYYPTLQNESVRDLAFHADSLFVSVGNRVLHVKANNPAIADPTVWTIDNRFPVLDSSIYSDLETVSEALYVARIHPDYGKDSVFSVNNAGLEYVSEESFEFEIRSLSNQDGKLSLSIDGAIFVYADDLQSYHRIYNDIGANQFMAPVNSYLAGDQVYVADKNRGLISFPEASGSGSYIDFIGPPKSSFYALDWSPEAGLVVAGGGLNGISRTYNISGMYRLLDNEWSLMDLENQTGWDTIDEVHDFFSIGAHPSNGTFAVGSYSDAALTIFNEEDSIVAVYDENNSLLTKTSLSNGDHYVSGVQYDAAGNLFVLNGYADQIIKVLSKEGEWYAYDLGANSKNRQTFDLLLDYNDVLWAVVAGQGLFAYDYNGTLDNPNDDRMQRFTNSEIGGALPSNNVTAVAVDFDNEIWVGTEAGFAIIYNPTSAFDAAPGDYNAQRIKLEFEGNVEFLLGSTFISDIEIDGGNRKWIATAGSGVFCLSPDGLTIIENFTAENSPLISDNILDIEIDQSTGEMYIVTDQGFISTRIDASYQDPNYSDVIVFPNPVRPDFNGVITIQGIKFDSDVRITDIGGNLVYETTSNGGTATWNGKRVTGENVASGVYLIWTAPNDGKGREVGKVVVIRD